MHAFASSFFLSTVFTADSALFRRYIKQPKVAGRQTGRERCVADVESIHRLRQSTARVWFVDCLIIDRPYLELRYINGPKDGQGSRLRRPSDRPGEPSRTSNFCKEKKPLYLLKINPQSRALSILFAKPSPHVSLKSTRSLTILVQRNLDKKIKLL